MFKLLKNKKIFKIVAFMLVAVFSINIAGCGEPNDVIPGQEGGGNKNFFVGVGENVNGYMVYAESTFDPMTEDLFMGYLLSGRDFSLVVVPGEWNDETEMYELSNDENYLFNQANNGIYKYNDYIGGYENPEEKALLYYVTDDELLSWFNKFEADDTFASNALEFAQATVDVAKPSRFKCEDLVNFGDGLNATDFCGRYEKKSDDTYSLTGGIISKEMGSDPNGTGGMILLFGYTSIEGYITYDHIKNFEGSKIANTLASSGCSYAPGGVGAFDYESILVGEYGDRVRSVMIEEDNDESWYRDDDFRDSEGKITATSISNFLNANGNVDDQEAIRSDIISAYTEVYVAGKTGCELLKRTYQLIEQSIRTDNNITGDLRSFQDTLEEDMYKVLPSPGQDYQDFLEKKDRAEILYDMIDMLYDFDDYKEQEAFNIKFSASLFSRYKKIISLPSTDNLLTGHAYSNVSHVNKERMAELVKGTAEEGAYVAVVTAQGFILDRGSEEDRIVAGASDMLGVSGLLQELVKMDACPNGTIAAEMFNMLANLKIVVGAALAVAGAVAVTVAVVGLTVASVIAKLAMVSSITPVPGGRIAALVLLAIAGLIALGVGIYSLISGLKDKANLKGMGASETNYCKTYVATFERLFDSIQLTVPVYHYEIQKRNVGDGHDSIYMNYCKNGEIDPGTNQDDLADDRCVDDDGNVIGEPTEIPMYYYADYEYAEELDLDGMPIIMYYEDDELVDYIYGAATPSFIVEMLRLWGLLAMREIVYKAQTIGTGNDINKVSIHHTTNTNARTMKIFEARYCYTLKYNLSLYDTSNNATEFCYFDGSSATVGEGGYKVNDFANISWSSGKSGEIFNVDIQSSKTAVLDKFANKYSESASVINYFYNSPIYRYDRIKDEHVEILNEDITSDVSNVSVNLISLSGDYQVSYTRISTGENVTEIATKEFVSGGSVNGYLVTEENIYEINLTFDTETDTLLSYTVKHVAHFKTSLTDLKAALENENKQSDPNDNMVIEYKQYLKYIIDDGVIEGQESEVETIPVYFTATVKESPHSNYYYKNGSRKTCDDGEYVYWRDNKVFSDKYKCLADGKSKKKDTPRDTSNVGGGATYNYYSTSIKIGTVKITLKSDGSVETEIVWEKPNIDESAAS